MNNQEHITLLLKSLTGQANTLSVPRPLIKFMDSVEGGLFLSQLIYWSDKGKQGEWFYKSYQDWEEEICISEYKVRKFAAQCEEMGFLETKLKKANGAPTIHYRLDMELLARAILKFLGMDSETTSERILEPLQEPLTETTTTTTTERVNGTPEAEDDWEPESIPTLPGADVDDYDPELVEMESSLWVVCRERPGFGSDGKIRKVAKSLLSDGYTPEEVEKHFGEGGYWYVASFGQDGQKPYAMNVLNEIEQAKRGVTAGNNHKSNGSQEFWR